MRNLASGLRFALGLLGIVLLASCGSGAESPQAFPAPTPNTPTTPTTPPEEPAGMLVSFLPGPISYAVEAEASLAGVTEIESVTFTVHTKPGNVSEPIRVTYGRPYLDRHGAIDAGAGSVRFPVFGLYPDYANQVSISVARADGFVFSDHYTVQAAEPQLPPEPALVRFRAPALETSFILLQAFGGPRVVDIDGETRWEGPQLPDSIFPRMTTRDGLVLGSTGSGHLYRCDWLGRTEQFTMSDPRLVGSHHNLERGKAGILNTVTVQEDGFARPLSVLVETTETGDTLREWNFDQIFIDRIQAKGEDPASLVKVGGNWFHMNSAIYDASDDSVLASSRENFVVKADYATGEIKWILGNPGKAWYTAYPMSLQPLALTVIGDPPVGQHALSVSEDGQHLMLFNNGMGHLQLPPVGDDRAYSKVSIYRIDDVARTAEEVWSYDRGQSVYSPFCSSAYPTASGNVMVTYASPGDLEAFVVVVDTTGAELLHVDVLGGGCGVAYAAEEILLQSLQLD